MITAKEAREKVDALKTERIKQEMKMVEEKINKAVQECEYYTWLGVLISDATQSKLESLGYNVEEVIDPDNDSSHVKVSWY